MCICRRFHIRSAVWRMPSVGRTDYARWLNIRLGEPGHVWQNRFYLCPLDERHRWEALRYVELNPVRAGLVGRATDWPWSSAAAHTTGVDRTGVVDMSMTCIVGNSHGYLRATIGRKGT